MSAPWPNTSKPPWRLVPTPREWANWVTGDIAAHLNAGKMSITELPLKPAQLAELVQLIDDGTISGKIAKDLLPELLEQGGSAQAIVADRGLGMISDPAAITAIVAELLAAHPAEVEAFRGGKNKLQGFFVGQLMKRTGGRADPKLANRILAEKLKVSATTCWNHTANPPAAGPSFR